MHYHHTTNYSILFHEIYSCLISRRAAWFDLKLVQQGDSLSNVRLGNIPYCKVFK